MTDEESSHDAFTSPTSPILSWEANKKRKLNKINTPSSVIEGKDEIINEALDVLRTPRDDCDVFGEFVAIEVRQIRSEKRRRILKRTIQRAIIDAAEEEDRWESLSPAASASSF